MHKIISEKGLYYEELNWPRPVALVPGRQSLNPWNFLSDGSAIAVHGGS